MRILSVVMRSLWYALHEITSMDFPTGVGQIGLPLRESISTYSSNSIVSAGMTVSLSS